MLPVNYLRMSGVTTLLHNADMQARDRGGILINPWYRLIAKRYSTPQHSALVYSTEFTKYRVVGQFAISF